MFEVLKSLVIMTSFYVTGGKTFSGLFSGEENKTRIHLHKLPPGFTFVHYMLLRTITNLVAYSVGEISY